MQASSPVTATWQPRTVIALLGGYFVLFGIIVGGQGVLWFAIMRGLDLSAGTLGAAQLASPLVSVVLLLGGGPLSGMIGKKRLALIGLVLLGTSVLAIGLAGGIWSLVAALALAGLGFGAVELAMNSAVLDWEAATGRVVMNAMHAGFSAGAVLGALSAGAMLEQGWGYPAVLAVQAACCALALLCALPVQYPPVARAASANDPWGALRLLLTLGVALPAIISLLGVVGESVANSWSVIHLQNLGASAIVGGSAFALFNGTMFVGRLLNTPLVARAGARVSLLVSAGLTIAGGVALLLAGNVWLATLALALVGLGVAGVVPTALGAAALAAPGRSGDVAGALMAVTYTCFIICPPLVGQIADRVSLQAALAIVAISGVALGVLALRLRVPVPTR